MHFTIVRECRIRSPSSPGNSKVVLLTYFASKEMGKTQTRKVNDAKKQRCSSSDQAGEQVLKPTRSSGLAEIESLFSAKKKPPTKATPKKSSRKDYSKHRAKRSNHGNTSSSEWVDDGLGGKFNSEGYTGRSRDGCRIFKAHVLNKPSSGKTKDCPFDCNCCFI